MNQPMAAPQPRGRKGCGCGVIAALVALILVVPAVFIVPISAPQTTCDVLAPIMGCAGGKAPSCFTGKGKFGHGIKRKTTYSIEVSCPEGEGSSAPIWILAFSIVFLMLAAFGVTAILTARARRRA